MSTRRGRLTACWASVLTLRMSPLLKLSSSSAVALKSYLAMASILSGAQSSAAWSRGGRESSLLKRPSALGSASPLFGDWLPNAGTHNATLNQKSADCEKWPDRRQPRPARRPAVPAPTPPGSVGLSPPPSLPGRSPELLLPLFSLSPQATDRPAGQWRRRLGPFPITLPLPSRWVCSACRNRLESRWSPPFLPRPSRCSRGTKCSPPEERPAPRDGPLLFSVIQAPSLLSPTNRFGFLKKLGPLLHSQKAATWVWSRAALTVF